MLVGTAGPTWEARGADQGFSGRLCIGDPNADVTGVPAGLKSPGADTSRLVWASFGSSMRYQESAGESV
jgi:hypothetical protein